MRELRRAEAAASRVSALRPLRWSWSDQSGNGLTVDRNDGGRQAGAIATCQARGAAKARPEFRHGLAKGALW